MIPSVGGIDEMKVMDEWIKDPSFAVQEEAETPVPTPEPEKEISNEGDKPPVEKTDAPEFVNTPKEEVVTPAPEATPEVVQTPEIDYGKILGEKSNGRIKSEEDLNKILTEYDQTQELLNSDTYQYAAKLSAWEKAGHPKELFAPIQELTTDEIKALDPRDLLSLKMKFENPKWTEEDIELLINEEYKQVPEDNTENVIRVGKLRMEREANSFRGKLNELKQLSHIPKSEDLRAQSQQSETLRQTTWKQNVPKLVNEFNKISIQLDEAGKDVFDWVPTDKQKQELQAEMEKIITNVQVPFDEKGIESFKSVMKEKFINKNINQIVKAAAGRAVSKKTEEVIKEIHNPTGAKTEAVPSAPPVKSDADVAWDQILKEEIYGTGRR